MVISGLLSGLAAGLVAWGGVRATVRSLVKRVSILEACSLQHERSLGRLEGRAEKC